MINAPTKMHVPLCVCCCWFFFFNMTTQSTLRLLLRGNLGYSTDELFDLNVDVN